MRLPLLLTLAVAAAGCPSSNACGPGNCRGCCTPNGTCETGFDDTACGANGTGCNDCRSANATCNATHVCLSNGAAGGNGGAGGGGGNMMIPPGTNEQQLISGTRLKAVRFISAEGAQAPAAIFWDKQLSIACSPGTFKFAAYSTFQLTSYQFDLGRGYCFPALVALEASGGGAPYVFRDSTCIQPLATGAQSAYRTLAPAGPASPMGILSAASVKYGVRADGGSTSFHRSSHARRRTPGLPTRRRATEAAARSRTRATSSTTTSSAPTCRTPSLQR